MGDLSPTQTDAQVLQDRLVSFIRAFGLHQPEHTPCGQPIPVSEAHALAELTRDAPLGQAELGRRLRLEKSTVSRLVGQLIGRGWLERRPDPGDGRATLLVLTPAASRPPTRLRRPERPSSPGCWRPFPPPSARPCCIPWTS
jgi:DNA-binding MarR family transcriptional regulator